MIVLKSSRSRKSTVGVAPSAAACASASATCSAKSLRFGKPGQRVVECLVPELLLDAVVLEQHGGVARKRLEQLAIVGVERRHVTGPVADDQQPEDAVLAAKQGEHCVPEVVLDQVAVERRILVPPCEHERVVLRRRDLKRGALGGAEVGRLEEALPDRRREASQCSFGGGRREQHHLGELRAQHRACGTEQLSHRGARLGRGLHRAHRPVEELEVLVAPPLRGIGTERQHAAPRREEEDPDRARVLLHQLDRRDREGRPGDAADEGGPGHVRQLAQHRPAFGQRDRRAHEGDARRAECRRPGKRPGPARGAERVAEAAHRVEDHECEAGAERELCEVERRLEGPLAADDDQSDRRAAELAGDQPARSGQEQPEHERDLAEGEAVRLGPEVQVNRVRLREEEQHRDSPPGNPHGACRRGDAADQPLVEQERGQRDDEREQPDPRAPVRDEPGEESASYRLCRGGGERVLHQRLSAPRGVGPVVAGPAAPGPRAARPAAAGPGCCPTTSCRTSCCRDQRAARPAAAGPGAPRPGVAVPVAARPRAAGALGGRERPRVERERRRCPRSPRQHDAVAASGDPGRARPRASRCRSSSWNSCGSSGRGVVVSIAAELDLAGALGLRAVAGEPVGVVARGSLLTWSGVRLGYFWRIERDRAGRDRGRLRGAAAAEVAVVEESLGVVRVDVTSRGRAVPAGASPERRSRGSCRAPQDELGRVRRRPSRRSSSAVPIESERADGDHVRVVGRIGQAGRAARPAGSPCCRRPRRRRCRSSRPARPRTASGSTSVRAGWSSSRRRG